MHDRLSEAFLKELEEHKHTLNIPRSNKISGINANAIMRGIKNHYKLEKLEDSLVVIGVFAQRGGASPACDGNMIFEYRGKTYKLSEVRQIFAQNNQKNGIRKFARTYGTKTYQICKRLNVEGNMYQKILRLNPDNKEIEHYKYWLSDFQASNEDAPIEARKLIMAAFPKKKKNLRNK